MFSHTSDVLQTSQRGLVDLKFTYCFVIESCENWWLKHVDWTPALCCLFERLILHLMHEQLQPCFYCPCPFTRPAIFMWSMTCISTNQLQHNITGRQQLRTTRQLQTSFAEQDMSVSLSLAALRHCIFFISVVLIAAFLSATLFTIIFTVLFIFLFLFITFTYRQDNIRVSACWRSAKESRTQHGIE